MPLRACGRCGSLQNLILKGDPFGIVFLEPGFRGVSGSEDLDVLGVANLLARVDVNLNDHSSSSACALSHQANRSAPAAVNFM